MENQKITAKTLRKATQQHIQNDRNKEKTKKEKQKEHNKKQKEKNKKKIKQIKKEINPVIQNYIEKVLKQCKSHAQHFSREKQYHFIIWHIEGLEKILPSSMVDYMKNYIKSYKRRKKFDLIYHSQKLKEIKKENWGDYYNLTNESHVGFASGAGYIHWNDLIGIYEPIYQLFFDLLNKELIKRGFRIIKLKYDGTFIKETIS